MSVDKASGLLTSVRLSAVRSSCSAPLKPNFWRAPTDNDFGNYMQDWAAVWEQAGRNRTLRVARRQYERPLLPDSNSHLRFCTDDDGRKLADLGCCLRVYPSDGRIHVDNHFARNPDLPVVPRIGMNIELSPLARPG